LSNFQSKEKQVQGATEKYPFLTEERGLQCYHQALQTVEFGFSPTINLKRSR